jgi:endo-1,4-beta-xylanase
MKWDTVQGTEGRFNFGPGDAIVSFAATHGMKVKGHALVWHHQRPDWVTNISTADRARTVLLNHVRTTVGHYKGKVYAWDVVNEAISDEATPKLRDEVFNRRLGEAYIDTAFRAAHEADPNALLFYNDYSIEAPNKKFEAVYGLVSRLKQRGVPIHGVGFQTHVGAVPGATAQEFASVLKRIADLGLLVNISEMDVHTGSVQGDLAAKFAAQKTRYQELVGACLAQPKCQSITLWGITDKYSWLNSQTMWQWIGAGPHYPLPWDDRYEKKPAYFGILAALSG